jgi:D-lactate dehydrogenase (cytochrome)
VELLDAPLVDVIRRHADPGLAPLPTLYFDFHGTPGEVGAVSRTVEEIVLDAGGQPLRWLRDDAGARALWETRRLGTAWAKAERPGAVTWPTDVCVPVSRLAEVLLETRAEVDATGLTAYLVGHVGDGNFHCVFILDPNDAAEAAAVARLSDHIVARALAVGGTCTGEHGVGLGKRGWLVAEHGADAVAVMRALKATLDPLGLLNPGKVFADLPAARADGLAPALRAVR